MRFSAAIHQIARAEPAPARVPARAPEREPVRVQPTPVLPDRQELPLDLDQRVRLSGEW